MMGKNMPNEEGLSLDPVAMMLDIKRELKSLKWKNTEEIKALKVKNEVINKNMELQHTLKT